LESYQENGEWFCNFLVLLWPIKNSVFREKEGEENKREIPEKEKEENSKHK
jgi:hypothetical protein